MPALEGRPNNTRFRAANGDSTDSRQSLSGGTGPRTPTKKLSVSLTAPPKMQADSKGPPLELGLGV